MTTITPALLAEIKASAEKATPGPWRVEDGTTLIWGACDEDDMSTYGMGYPIAETRIIPSGKWAVSPDADDGAANVAHITRMDPPTTLALVDALEEARREVAKAEEERAEQWRQRREAEGSRDVANAACDTFRAENERLRAALSGALAQHEYRKTMQVMLSEPEWVGQARAAMKETPMRKITMTIEVEFDDVSEDDIAEMDENEFEDGVPSVSEYTPKELCEPIVDSLTPDNLEIWAGSNVYATIKSAKLLSVKETGHD